MVSAVLDLGIDLNVWPWVWLAVGITFATIELTVLAGAFVLLPFAVSAFAAALLGFYDVSIEIQWAVFIGGGALIWILLYKRVMKFAGENEMSPGVGADRLVGMTAIVTATIDPNDTDRKGRVQVEGEVWSALSDGRLIITEGSKVRITEMHGTRVRVEALTHPPTNAPPSAATATQFETTPGRSFMNPIAIVVGVIALIGIAVLVGAVKIVRPYQRGLVERLGKYKATREPGLNLIMPFIETMQLIDMREQVVDVPPQEVITADNVVVSVDAVVYYEATDPQRLVYNIADFFTAITKLAQTNLRNLIGDMELDRALTSRDTINTQLREVLDDATDKWGVRVVRVEIQRIDPPPDIVSAMHAQMRAERDRRATVTEAKGYQEAAIARADGEQQAAVLSATGRKEAAILDAQGESEAIQLRAHANKIRLEMLGQGEGLAAKARLTGIKEAHTDNNVLTVEYLSALEKIGDGRATKMVIPVEFSGLLGTVAALAETIRPDESGDDVRPKDGLAIPEDNERVELPEPDRAEHRSGGS